MLAKALRPPPEKHHGLSDVETRLRRRELDLIANEPTRRLFIDRARIISAVRAYLDENGFVEVETPVLQPLYGGALARPFTTHHNALDRDLYLRIATELYLKRLLVGGLERVYELGKDFRNEGLSTKHNPEFTMVEWYEAYADYRSEAERLQEIVRRAAAAVDYEGELDFASPWRRVTFFEAVAEATGIELGADREASALAEQIAERGLELKVEGASLGADGRRPALQVRRAPPAAAHLRARLPGRAVPVRPRPPRAARAGRALGGVRRGDGDRQRLQRAHRPRHPARALRGPAAPAGGRATRSPSPTTRASWRRSSRECRRPAGWVSASIAW